MYILVKLSKLLTSGYFREEFRETQGKKDFECITVVKITISLFHI